jgi:hypothetical protein
MKREIILMVVGLVLLCSVLVVWSKDYRAAILGDYNKREDDIYPNPHCWNVRFEKLAILIGEITDTDIVIHHTWTMTSYYSQREINENFDVLIDALQVYINTKKKGVENDVR